MIRVKMLPQNKVCVLDSTGKTYIFNQAGICIEEDAGLGPAYTNNMVKLPILSILSCNNTVDIACFDGEETMKRYSTNLDAMTVAMKLQMNGGFIRMLRRDGRQDGKAFNQLMFVYKDTYNVFDIIHK